MLLLHPAKHQKLGPNSALVRHRQQAASVNPGLPGANEPAESSSSDDDSAPALDYGQYYPTLLPFTQQDRERMDAQPAMLGHARDAAAEEVLPAVDSIMGGGFLGLLAGSCPTSCWALGQGVGPRLSCRHSLLAPTWSCLPTVLTSAPGCVWRHAQQQQPSAGKAAPDAGQPQGPPAAEALGLQHDAEGSGQRMLLLQLPGHLPLKSGALIDLTASGTESRSPLHALSPELVSPHCQLGWRPNWVTAQVYAWARLRSVHETRAQQQAGRPAEGLCRRSASSRSSRAALCGCASAMQSWTSRTALPTGAPAAGAGWLCWLPGCTWPVQCTLTGHVLHAWGVAQTADAPAAELWAQGSARGPVAGQRQPLAARVQVPTGAGGL